MAKFDSKSIFWILLNAILTAGILVLLVGGAVLWKYSNSIYPARVIEVSAEGKVSMSPDVANLSFSVVSEGADPEKIQDENNSKINTALDFIKQQRVAEKDIKTAGYNLSPHYQYDEKKRLTFIKGYTLTQTIAVKIRDLSKVGTILAGLPSRGINQIGSLSFDIDDPDKFLNQAREDAFTKARAKAEAMARQNGTRIKKVITFSEFTGANPYPMPYGVGGFRTSLAPVTPAIQPGSQEVKVRVSVAYEIW